MGGCSVIHAPGQESNLSPLVAVHSECCLSAATVRPAPPVGGGNNQKSNARREVLSIGDEPRDHEGCGDEDYARQTPDGAGEGEQEYEGDEHEQEAREQDALLLQTGSAPVRCHVAGGVTTMLVHDDLPVSRVNVMDWLNLAAFIIAALSFLGMCWQMVRAETVLPSAALHLEWDARGLSREKHWNRLRIDVGIRPAFGYSFTDAHVIETTDWPSARVKWLKRYSRRVTEDGEPLTHTVRFREGDSARFIVQVLSLSVVLRRPIARAWLVEVSDSGVVRNRVRYPKVSIRPWKWFPGVTILSVLNRLLSKTRCSLRLPLGHWCRLKLDWQDHLPDHAFQRSRRSGESC